MAYSVINWPALLIETDRSSATSPSNPANTKLPVPIAKVPNASTRRRRSTFHPSARQPRRSNNGTNHTTSRWRRTHVAFGAIIDSPVPQGKEIHMTDEVRGAGGEKPDPEAVGEVDAMNWACTVCGYSIEGVLPETCPDCGADKEDFENVPIPGM